jgi:hypothetical protein
MSMQPSKISYVKINLVIPCPETIKVPVTRSRILTLTPDLLQYPESPTGGGSEIHKDWSPSQQDAIFAVSLASTAIIRF